MFLNTYILNTLIIKKIVFYQRKKILLKNITHKAGYPNEKERKKYGKRNET